MNKSSTILASVLIFVVVLTCGLLYGQKATQELEPLKIGVSASLSGPAVGWGQPCYRTIDLQASLYNEAGGVKIGNKKYKIELKVADDKYLGESGAAAINRLIFQEKVDYILLGGPSTLVALAGGPICQKNEVLFLVDGTSGPGLSPDLTWLFRPCLTDYSRGLAITLWLAANKPEIKKIAFVCPDTEGGHAGTNIFKNNVMKYTNWEVVGGEYFEPASKEYHPILSKVIKTKPDLIFTDTATTGDLGLLLKQGRELGYNGPYLQAAVIDPRIICGISGVKAADDLYNPGNPRDVSPELKKLYDAYNAKYGEYNALTDWVCDFLPVLIQAMQVAGTTDKYKVRKVLESATKPGILNSLIGPGARFYEEVATSPGHSRQWLRPMGIMRVNNGEGQILALYSPDEMIKKIAGAK